MELEPGSATKPLPIMYFPSLPSAATVRNWVAGFGFPLGMGIMLIAGSNTQVSAAASPDYTLFVGVDLFLSHQDEQIAIRRLERKRALLDTPDRQAVKLVDGTGFTWKMATKVCSTSATIAGLESKRVFSPANDPKMQTMKLQSNVQSYLSERMSVAQAGIARAANNAHFAEAAAANPYNSAPQSFDESGTGIMMNADAELTTASLNMDAMQNTGLFDDMTDVNGLPNQYDAMEISFDLSSAMPMANAIVVVVADIKSDDTAASTSFHHEIGPVTTKPRRISFMQMGLPAGYELESTRIYLFNYGEEIPTNLSERKYKITDAQAREFLHIDYISTHKSETLPARPEWSVAPVDLMSAASAHGFDIPISVDLDATGKLLAIHDTNQVIPATVRSVVQQLTFLPALEKGKPVASTITVNPADFFKN